MIDRLSHDAKTSLAPERPAIILSGFIELHRSLYDQSFPFFGRVKTFTLGNLEHEAVTELVTEPMREIGIRIAEPNEVVNRIIYHTGGMPSVVQSLCAQVVETLASAPSPVLTPELVERLISTQTPLSDYLNWFDFNTNPIEKAIVYYSAPQRRFSLSAFRRFARGSIHTNQPFTELNIALDHLAFANIFREVKRHESYDFSVEAFRKVIEERVRREGDITSIVRDLFRK